MLRQIIEQPATCAAGAAAIGRCCTRGLWASAAAMLPLRTLLSLTDFERPKSAILMMPVSLYIRWRWAGVRTRWPPASQQSKPGGVSAKSATTCCTVYVIYKPTTGFQHSELHETCCRVQTVHDTAAITRFARFQRVRLVARAQSTHATSTCRQAHATLRTACIRLLSPSGTTKCRLTLQTTMLTTWRAAHRS